jgi:CO dehydrogenase/acetyl-CoA synthase alpha subunit
MHGGRCHVRGACDRGQGRFGVALARKQFERDADQALALVGAIGLGGWAAWAAASAEGWIDHGLSAFVSMEHGYHGGGWIDAGPARSIY